MAPADQEPPLDASSTELVVHHYASRLKLYLLWRASDVEVAELLGTCRLARKRLIVLLLARALE